MDNRSLERPLRNPHHTINNIAMNKFVVLDNATRLTPPIAEEGAPDVTESGVVEQDANMKATASFRGHLSETEEVIDYLCP